MPVRFRNCLLHARPSIASPWLCLTPVSLCWAVLLSTGSSKVKAEDIHLVGGDVLSVEIIERNDDLVIAHHEALGRLEIEWSRIDFISGPIGNTDTDGNRREIPRLAALQDESPKVWESHFTLGAVGSFGNTDTQSVTLSINSVRERENEVLKLDLSYYLGMTDGDRTDNRLTAGARQDWLIPDSRWLYFAQGRYDFDEFQSWDYRLGAHAGIGYKWIDEEDFKATLRAGAGVNKEFNSDDDGYRPEALAGISLEWTLSEKQSFNLESMIYPDLEETGEFRLITTANWSLMVDEESNISLTAGVFYEHQSEVDTGIEKDDVKIHVGLQFNF